MITLLPLLLTALTAQHVRASGDLPPRNREHPRMHWLSFLISNLSPELHYTPPLDIGNTDPESGWVVERNYSWTRHAEASIEWRYWGYASFGRGVARGVNVEVEERMDLGDTWPDGTPRWSYTGIGGGGSGEQNVIHSTVNRFFSIDPNYYRLPFQEYNITVALPTVEYGGMINVSSIEVLTGLPERNSQNDTGFGNTTWTYAPAVSVSQSDDNNTIASIFTDPDNAWSISEPTYNNSRPLTALTYRAFSGPDWNPNESSFYSPRNTEIISDSNPFVISTTTPDAPIRFVVPRNSSFLQVLGTVGTNHGDFELRLLPQTTLPENDDELREFKPHPSGKGFTARRPINATAEILSNAWLDPRLEYEAEIVLLGSGSDNGDAELNVHGVSFVRMTEEGDNGRLVEWWERENAERIARHEPSGGLSGGAIAGIVVGSVVGVAIIGGIIFFIWRRRRNSARADKGTGKTSPDPFTDNAGTTP